MVWYGFVGIVWYGGGSDVFIHEEISIMDYNGLSRTIIEGGVTTGLDDWLGLLACMNSMDDWHG